MSDDLFPTDRAATYLQTPVATLAWWRHKGLGPRYLKVGRRVFYRKSALDQFLEASEITPEAIRP